MCARSSPASIALLLIGLAAFTTPASSQSKVRIAPEFSRRQERPASSIRIDVSMVMIAANVTDLFDKPILNLQKDDFRVYESGKEQKIESFVLEDAPVSVGIVFDASGSMTNKIRDSFTAVKQFLSTAVPGDEFSLITFSDTPQIIVPFTSRPDEIHQALTLIRPIGWTAMFDAIRLAVNHMRFARNSRKALLILSDGGDNNSRYSGSEVINILREADVRVFGIGLLQNEAFLKKAADETGGALITVHKISELPSAMDKLGIELRSEYVLGYYPDARPRDGKFHNVKVTVNQPASNRKLRLSWRHGYYAPY